MRKLLVATDLSARSDRALERAVRLARAHRAALTVLHVVDENLPGRAIAGVMDAAEAEIRELLADLIERNGVVATVDIVAGNHFREILQAAEREASDLIILGRHRNESCDAAFGGTTMGRVIRMGRHPVLVVSDRTDGAYRKVMVGIDFSEYSRHALRTAAALAPDAEFHLVHAFDVPFQGFLPGEGVRREIGEDHDRALSRLIEEEAAALSGACGGRPKMIPVLCQGNVIGVLRQQAERIRPDLLAIGTHGRSGLAGVVLGSIAQALLDHPPCDVLAVRLAQ